jgi:hypothetical protein
LLAGENLPLAHVLARLDEDRFQRCGVLEVELRKLSWLYDSAIGVVGSRKQPTGNSSGAEGDGHGQQDRNDALPAAVKSLRRWGRRLAGLLGEQRPALLHRRGGELLVAADPGALRTPIRRRDFLMLHESPREHCSSVPVSLESALHILGVASGARRPDDPHIRFLTVRRRCRPPDCG